VHAAFRMAYGAGKNNLSEGKNMLSGGPDMHGAILVVHGKEIFVHTENLPNPGFFFVLHAENLVMPAQGFFVHAGDAPMPGQEFSVHAQEISRVGQEFSRHGKVCRMHGSNRVVHDREFSRDDPFLVQDKDVLARVGSDAQLRPEKLNNPVFFFGMLHQE